MKGVKFNENTRVQLPALIHLTRLGYVYFGKISKTTNSTLYDSDTNILIEVFKNQFKKLNPNFKGKIEQILFEIKQELNNDDLGESFYKRLISSEKKMIDFKNIKNNIFHFTAEFTYKNGEHEFRPDITLFINGIPLVFIEVKKPNNNGGIISEIERMNNFRFPNKNFRRFINITQLMIFSNNMEYSKIGGNVTLEGSFYCTASKNKSFLNYFREESINNNDNYFYFNYLYKNIDKNIVKKILDDFNCQEIFNTPEYQKNLEVITPTNKIITSMCSPERLLFLIKYGIAYVKSTKEVDGKMVWINEKHIMRYQQIFASFAIKNKLEENKKSGIIWHTQGSGKTALSYYLTKYLTDYFTTKNKVAKFYFIVDRLDLLEQAKQEFESRGLFVKTANNKEELMKQFQTNQSMEGNSGNLEITVVNIQRFAEDKSKINLPKYATNLQRIFIIDEAHRGYKPEGSFLSNLFNADINSIKIALTGTPLLKEERASWKIFGEYIHTYYYDKSIKDGYTLKIIREDIETSYRKKLTEIYDKLDLLIKKNNIKKSEIIEHESYVKELTRFIIDDLKKFRIIRGDNSLGGMIICETSDQAKKIYELFNEVQKELNNENNLYKSNFKVGLILHDSDDNETRKQIINNFKKNMTIDILIVFNMLLTGFDAPRLKRLYFGRKLKDHNLLQAMTRVNRPYKDNKYGYIIDFADIKKNFEETNAAYLEELGRFNEATDEKNFLPFFNQVLEDPQNLIYKIENAKELLFKYPIDNLESFSEEISSIEDKKEVLKLKNALIDLKDSFNSIKTFPKKDFEIVINKLKIDNLTQMISIVSDRINFINQKNLIESQYDHELSINEILLNIEFKFTSNFKEELSIASKYDLDQKLKKTKDAIKKNIDKDDFEFISIYKTFYKKFQENGFIISNIQECQENLKYLNLISENLDNLNKKNHILYKKYGDDVKMVRVHKRIVEKNKKRNLESLKPIISNNDNEIWDLLFNYIKSDLDQKVYDKNDILKKPKYFEKIIKSIINLAFKTKNIIVDNDSKLFIVTEVKSEYLKQYNEHTV